MNFESFKRKYQKVEVNHYPNRITECPKVSVLVQTFNHEFFIRECLEGILIQKTDFEFEILLGEDQSSDNTREICIEYAKKYPKKIRLFLHHPENKIKVLGTTTGNFNAFYNLFSAKGELIAFCEGDDVWNDPLKLQKQVDFLNNNSSCTMVYHCFTEVNTTGNTLPPTFSLDQPSGHIKKEKLLRLDKHPLLSTVCFRNYFRDRIPEEIVKVINVDSFLLSILGRHGGAGFIESVKCSLYRRHDGGIWSKNGKTFKFSSKSIVFYELAVFYRRTGNYMIAAHFNNKKREVLKMLINHHLRTGKLYSAIVTAGRLLNSAT